MSFIGFFYELVLTDVLRTLEEISLHSKLQLRFDTRTGTALIILASQFSPAYDLILIWQIVTVNNCLI